VDTLAWLLESEPAIRWQALRDLTDASPSQIAAERERVTREGLVATILQRQQADGSWRVDGEPLWLPTLFTLLFLRATGADRRQPAVESALSRLERGLAFSDKDGCWELRPAEPGRTFFDGEVEPCINGGVLGIGAYFGRPTEGLARRLVGEQLEDGGWNCDAPKSVRSSFHTTICVLEGLLEYERATGSALWVAVARERGEEYLLQRGLFRRRSTGEVANPEFLELAFPPRYRYDVLRGLDYFRAAGGAPDPRMKDAVAFIQSKRQSDGRWPLDRAYDQSLGFTTGEKIGEPSRWNTLRALRVLRCYGSASS
jgi:hypothetical protein